jgi:hypothetical protein
VILDPPADGAVFELGGVIIDCAGADAPIDQPADLLALPSNGYGG